ncbi:MAG: hypothetical protein HOB52_08295 [Euryarchaeota archaeon]|nr:hypothetical protein [Euryarchaeota archaeon]
MRTGKSLFLVMLMMMSTLVLLVPVAPQAMAVNETNVGVITGTETWSGTHTLSGDVQVAPGAKLIINAGTTVNIPNGTYIEVEGSICAGSSICGASQASTGSPVRFIWADPANASANGRCSFNSDAKCGEGVILRSSIDSAPSSTGMSFVEFTNGYGYPILATGQSNPYLSVLIFDGASIHADNLKFSDINTSNVLAMNLAAPTITDSTFVVGTDEEGWKASAVRAYGSGNGILSTFTIRSSTFTGATADECGSQSEGLAALLTEDSFIALESISISNNAYGAFFASSSGSLATSTFDIQCNAIDTNGHKTTGNIKHWLTISNSSITTDEGAGLTAYDSARVKFADSTITGASEGSGIGVRGATIVANNNVIGPIGGWNGVWVYGDEFDVTLENNTINATKEPLLIGEYHYQDEGWNVPSPSQGVAYIANNTISGSTETCSSQEMYGGDFDCPSIHVFMSSATIVDNVGTGGAGDAIRATGAILNVQRNNIETGDFAVRAGVMDDNYGNKYATLGFFAENVWPGAGQVYNITESSITVQSEYIADPDPSSNETYPVSLSWGGAECPYLYNECLQLSDSKYMPPRGMPLGMEIINNASIFMYANLTNFDLDKAHIQNQNTAWGVQLQEGELVRLRAMVKGVHVSNADIIIRDAVGREVYNMTTDPWGYSPWVSLPSDFHIDTNWNHLANGANENSCDDGIDNDGDSVMDSADPDCQGGGREMSTYHVTASKFGKGSIDYTFNLTGQLDDVVSLNNIGPNLVVDQQDNQPFKRIITMTGSAVDGIDCDCATDYEAWLSQFGNIKEVQVKPPGVTNWDNAYIAVDTSGSNGLITRENHPWSSWTFDWDMGQQAEDDYTFEIRAFDGLDYSPILTRVFQLNTAAPLIYVDSPANHSSHDGSSVTFTGRASDPYAGINGNDIQKIHFEIRSEVEGSDDFYVTTTTPGGPAWSYTWDFSAQLSGEYTFNIWASDSNFCKSSKDECAWRSLVLDIENENARPIIELSDPLPDAGGRISSSEATLIAGVSKDADGQVTKVLIEITDLQTGLLLQNTPAPITNFEAVGVWQSWSVTWDTRMLTHDFQYKLTAKAYDGYDWSYESEVIFTIDNPPDANNLRPVFNTTGWVENIQLFCDSHSQSFDRCTVAQINLHDWFYDPDGDLTWYNFVVVNDASDPSDDYYDDLVIINADGIAKYNPLTALDILGADMSIWTLEGVQFEVIDTSGSRNSSFLVNFVVQAIDFTATRADGEMDEPITKNNPALFEGRGRPGSEVYIRLVDGGREVNHTTIGADGFWRMEVSKNDLAGSGLNDISFEYNGQEIVHSVQSGVADEEGMSTIVWVILIIVIIAIIGGVFVFLFVEFEDEDDLVDMAEEVERDTEDPYAWAKKKLAEEAQQSALSVAAQAAPAPQPVANPEHPGWLWDPTTQQWVPDPNFRQ